MEPTYVGCYFIIGLLTAAERWGCAAAQPYRVRRETSSQREVLRLGEPRSDGGTDCGLGSADSRRRLRSAGNRGLMEPTYVGCSLLNWRERSDLRVGG